MVVFDVHEARRNAQRDVARRAALHVEHVEVLVLVVEVLAPVRRRGVAPAQLLLDRPSSGRSSCRPRRRPGSAGRRGCPAARTRSSLVPMAQRPRPRHRDVRAPRRRPDGRASCRRAGTSSRSSPRGRASPALPAATGGADPCSARSRGSAARCCCRRRRRRRSRRVRRLQARRLRPPRRPRGRPRPRAAATFVSCAMPKMSASRALGPLRRAVAADADISAGNVLSSPGSYVVFFGAPLASNPVKPTTENSRSRYCRSSLPLSSDERVAFLGPRHALVERRARFERRDHAGLHVADLDAVADLIGGVDDEREIAAALVERELATRCRC